MDIQPQVLPRLGMRYGPQVWHLKRNVLWRERDSRVLQATVKRPGITPKVPSLLAAVNGIQSCYGVEPVMGTDPEFFLQKDGQIVPAFDFLPDKHATSNGLFWDGFQAETTIDPWAHISRSNSWYGNPDWANKCHAVMAQTIGKQIQKLADLGLNIAPQPVWRIPRDMLLFASDAHVALGCDPSRNVYASYGRFVPRPRELPWRFAGGHVHFNLSAEERNTPLNIRYLVKTLDALVGIPSVCWAQNYDHFIRRRYYGLAGEYRLPAHGLEWRVLSNYWLMHPQAFMLTFDLARHALNLGRARLRNIFVGSERAIQQTIDYCDVRSAKDFMHLNREFYTAWSDLTYGHNKAFWEAIEGGLDKVIPNWGQNVVKDWQLSADWRQVKAWRDLK